MSTRIKRANTQVRPYGQTMKYNPDIHHRKSIRLKHYDYAEMGTYFVTICTHERACLFGEVMNGEMQLNDAGRMVENRWLELNRKFPTIKTNEYVIMPNHFHGIVFFVGADLRVCPDRGGCLVPQLSGIMYDQLKAEKRWDKYYTEQRRPRTLLEQKYKRLKRA